MTTKKEQLENQLNTITEAMEILVRSVNGTVAPEMRIEFIKESYQLLFALKCDMLNNYVEGLK